MLASAISDRIRTGEHGGEVEAEVEGWSWTDCSFKIGAEPELGVTAGEEEDATEGEDIEAPLEI